MAVSIKRHIMAMQIDERLRLIDSHFAKLEYFERRRNAVIKDYQQLKSKLSDMENVSSLPVHRPKYAYMIKPVKGTS